MFVDCFRRCNMSYLWLSGFAGVPDVLFCSCALSHRICVELIPPASLNLEHKLVWMSLRSLLVSACTCSIDRAQLTCKYSRNRVLTCSLSCPRGLALSLIWCNPSVMLSTSINICVYVCRLFSSLKHKLFMAQRLCWGARCSVSLLRAIPSHLCRAHPSSLAQPWTQACMNVSTVFACICLYMFEL